MPTPISEFYETLRFLLGDHDPTIQQYPDAVLAAAVRSTIRLQKVPGLAVDLDLMQLTPGIQEPNQWALVAYHVAVGFIASHPDQYAYNTRALSERFGGWIAARDELKRNIYKLENGTMFSGWINYYTWLAGMAGLPLGLVMAQLTVRAPFYTVAISTDGIHTGNP